MAASTLTIGEWESSSVNNKSVWTCTVTTTTADYDCYTKHTPNGLNPTLPWTLVINSAAETVDGATLPVDLYIGWVDSFKLTENNAPVVTDGILYKADIYDDVKGTGIAILMHPNLTVAEDATTDAAKCYVPIAPYYIVNLDGASTLNAVDVVFKIIQ